jgi:DNA-binding PadR family transcriptional regulator
MDERLCWLLACHGYVKETRADDGRVIYTPTPEGLRKADEIRPF